MAARAALLAYGSTACAARPIGPEVVPCHKPSTMSTAPSIAHYRITSKLGEGGMGAVYRATDTKLNREVAIKVLPDALANDPDYLARFTREAQRVSPTAKASPLARSQEGEVAEVRMAVLFRHSRGPEQRERARGTRSTPSSR